MNHTVPVRFTVPTQNCGVKIKALVINGYLLVNRKKFDKSPPKVIDLILNQDKVIKFKLASAIIFDL